MKDVDFFTPGARLALELECLLMDTRDAAVQSRWWDSAHEALEQWRQAIRGMEAAIDAAQPVDSTTLEQADSHARICSKLAEQHKRDAVLFAALTDAAAIIRDLMGSRLQESQIADPVHSDRALRLARVAELERFHDVVQTAMQIHVIDEDAIKWIEQQLAAMQGRIQEDRS